MTGRSFDYTPEEAHAIRVEAFGAIRRAAAVARTHDQIYSYWRQKGIQYAADEQWLAAWSIRRAIRAAIRSDKP